MKKLQTIAALEPQHASEDYFMVRDLLAKHQTRTHELVDFEDPSFTRKFTFNNDHTSVKVPFNYAVCLLGNEGFELKGANGNIIRPRKDQKDTAGQNINLAVNEVIAQLDELTAASLEKRVIEAGGSKGKKEEMIAYLIANNGGPSDYAPLTGNSKLNNEASPEEDELFDEDDLIEDDLTLDD